MLKNIIRDFLPAELQVPVKFLFNKIRNQLEPEVDLLPYLVKPGALAIDIGGNRGSYAYALWRLKVALHVFEPNPTCAHILLSWARNKNVCIHQVALSSREGTADLHIPVDPSGIVHDASASLEHDNFENTQNIQVPLSTLDGFGFSNVAFIKIDVEGHEADVLHGAKETIRSNMPALLIEIEQRHNTRSIFEIFELICELGYEGFYLDNMRLHPLSEFIVDRDQPLSHFGIHKARYINNFLFLNKNRINQGRYQSLMNSCQKV